MNGSRSVCVDNTICKYDLAVPGRWFFQRPWTKNTVPTAFRAVSKGGKRRSQRLRERQRTKSATPNRFRGLHQTKNAAPNRFRAVQRAENAAPAASVGFIRRKTPPPTASARFNGRKTPPPTASARFNGWKTRPQPLPWASTDEKRRPQPPPWASTDEKRRPSPPSNGRKLVPAPASGRCTGHKLTHVVGWRRYSLAACDSQLRRRWP